MAVLPDENRIEVWADLMRKASAIQQTVALTKSDLRAAVNAADDWVNSNSASFNSALPAAARANLTTSQKAWLLTLVVARRYDLGV